MLPVLHTGGRRNLTESRGLTLGMNEKHGAVGVCFRKNRRASRGGTAKTHRLVLPCLGNRPLHRKAYAAMHLQGFQGTAPDLSAPFCFSRKARACCEGERPKQEAERQAEEPSRIAPGPLLRTGEPEEEASSPKR